MPPTRRLASFTPPPRSVVRMMIDMLDPKEDETIYDPACGTGGMLLAAVQHVKDEHGDTKRLWGKLFGQEKNLTTSSIARMNLFLHGIEDFKIVRGDTLRNPAFFEGDHLAKIVQQGQNYRDAHHGRARGRGHRRNRSARAFPGLAGYAGGRA